MSLNNETDYNVLDEPSKDDHSVQPAIIAITTVLLVITFIFCAGRWYCRQRSRMGFGMDDYFCLGAVVPTLGFAVSMYISLRFGIGTHYASDKKMKGFIICYLINVWCYAVATVMTKIAVLSFYCRIFHSKRLVHISFAVTVFTILYNVVNIVVAMMECMPLSHLWTGAPAKCINLRLALTIVSLVNVLVDFVILSIPIRFVMKLHMDRIRRIQVCGVFLTGFLVCIIAILRMVGFAVAKSHDISYNLVWPGLAAFAEICIATIVACLPTMGILFNKTKQRFSALPPPRYLITRRSIGGPRIPDASLLRSDGDSKFLTTDPDTMPMQPTPTRVSFVSRGQQRQSDRNSRRIQGSATSSANRDGTLTTNMQQSQVIPEADESVEVEERREEPA